MGLESSFTLLRDIGSLQLNAQEEVRFSIDAYRGYRYVSVRKFLLNEILPMPTQQGVTLSPEMVRVLVPAVLALPQDAAQLKLGEVGKFAKRPGICVVVSIVQAGTVRGLELRQWEEDKGFTAKGILLPLSQWDVVRKLFADTLAAIDETPDVDL